MLTIRSRAIELAANPAGFDEPIRQISNPGDAKIEADAHLALCVDQLTTGMAASDEKRQLFHELFFGRMFTQNKFNANSQIPAMDAASIFEDVFNEAYVDTATINNVLAVAPQAANTKAACQQYYDICQAYRDSWAAQGHDYKLPISIAAYEDPADLLHAGLMTFTNEIQPFIKGLYRSRIPVDERARLLINSSDRLRRAGSLSIAQLQKKLFHVEPIIDKGVIDTHPNIKELRQPPVYNTPEEEVLRPHTGCLAMPDLPANEFIKGGSGIAKMHGLVARLIVATNMHALDSDSSGHAVMPRLADLALALEK